MDLTSVSLIQRVQQGDDEQSWRLLANIYMPLLKSWLDRYHVQPADADDLVQDVLLVVTRELPSFHHNQQTGAFRNWLRRILVNRLRNYWRARGRVDTASGGSELIRRLNEFEDAHSGLSRMWDSEHDRHLTRQLLEFIEPRFTETTRAAFRRLVLDGAAATVVAEELNLSLSAVFTAKSRVLRELRRIGKGLID